MLTIKERKGWDIVYLQYYGITTVYASKEQTLQSYFIHVRNKKRFGEDVMFALICYYCLVLRAHRCKSIVHGFR